MQWLRLPASERKDGDGLTPALVEILDKGLVRRNETNLIAAEVAARLGHERLWAVDDHTGFPTPDEDEAAASAAITGAWNNTHSRARREADARLVANLNKPGGVIALYRDYNSPAAAMAAYQSDFGATLVEPSSKAF